MGILPNMAVISELQYQSIPDALRMVEETFRATLATEFTEEGGEIFLGLLNEDAFRKRQIAGNKSYVAKANFSSQFTPTLYGLKENRIKRCNVKRIKRSRIREEKNANR